ncbi:MAG: cyclic nucleotide-binding protein [Lachnospiraceae bacterium]|nr:cyclic nucleotide-binding protein [Lachnospiraceae bacterium]
MNQSIQLKNVTKIYDGMQRAKALDQATLCINPGEFTSIIGKSGSGKSTLLNMISCIDRPTEGEILFGDEKLHAYREAQLTKWRGENVGIVFQFFQLIPTLTILENIILPMDFNHKYVVNKRKTIALDLLYKAGISECADKLPCEISGGQQQRAAIARSLANNPSFIIADEPTGNLDTANANSIINLFRTLSKEGTSVIMVTHNNEIASCTDRVITISDGKIISDCKQKAEKRGNNEQKNNK